MTITNQIGSFTAPLPNDIIRFSRGNNTHDNQPKQLELRSFAALWDMIDTDRGTAKGQQYICGPMAKGVNTSQPGKFRGEAHWRQAHLAENSQFLRFDCDVIPKNMLEPLISAVDKYAGCSYTTSSHTPENPRARLVIALSRPATRNECIRLGPAFERYLISQGIEGVIFDRSVYRPEQQCYLPLNGADFIVHEGTAALNIDALLLSEFSKSEDAQGKDASICGEASSAFNTLSVDAQRELCEKIKSALQEHKEIGKAKGYDSIEAKNLADDVNTLGAGLNWCWSFTKESLAAFITDLTKDNVNGLDRGQWSARVMLAARFAPIGSNDAEGILEAVQAWSQGHKCYEGYIADGNNAPELTPHGGAGDPFKDFDDRWSEGEHNAHMGNSPFKKLWYLENNRIPVPQVLLADGSAFDLFEQSNKDADEPGPRSKDLLVDTVNKEYVWDTHGLQIYGLKTRMYVRKDGFMGHFQNQQVPVGKNRTVGLGSYWMKSPYRRSINGMVLAPSEGEITTTGAFNTWQGYCYEAVQGDITPFIEVFNHLLPDEADRMFIIRWVAKLVQSPEIPFKVALAIHGRMQGTGKNTIFEAVGELLHRQHWCVIGNAQLTSSFNDWQLDKVFVIGDEVSNSSSRSEADLMKRYITATENSINPKGLPSIRQPNLIKYVLLSNRDEIVHIEGEDRRYFVAETTSNPLPKPMADRFYSWKKANGLSHLLFYLLNYDASGFDPTAPAPMNEAKASVIEAGKSGLDAWIEEEISERIAKGCVLVSIGDVLNAYQQTTKTHSSDKAVSNAIKRAGGLKLPKQALLKSGRRIRLHSLADHEKYLTMPDRELGNAFEGMLFGGR